MRSRPAGRDHPEAMPDWERMERHLLAAVGRGLAVSSRALPISRRARPSLAGQSALGAAMQAFKFVEAAGEVPKMDRFSNDPAFDNPIKEHA